MIEHPVISQIRSTGYPNMIAQPEHAGIDFFGNEILVGDEIIEHDGNVILADSLEDYLIEELGFEFKTAE
ncbi:YqaI family protein [Niallia circulans]|uniref:YqaI family protein n=1 Tax=Niallia circulans TaxID=1397 RepID=UPI003D95D422